MSDERLQSKDIGNGSGTSSHRLRRVTIACRASTFALMINGEIPDKRLDMRLLGSPFGSKEAVTGSVSISSRARAAIAASTGSPSAPLSITAMRSALHWRSRRWEHPSERSTDAASMAKVAASSSATVSCINAVCPTASVLGRKRWPNQCTSALLKAAPIPTPKDG